MAVFVARQRAESSLRFLHEKTNGFEPFHVANHMLVVRDYVLYLEHDEVLNALLTCVRRHLSTSAKAWVDLAVKGGKLPPLPEDPLACLALRWDFIRLIRLEKVDLRYFASCFYPGEHLNEKLMHWKRVFIHPWATDVRRLANMVIARLPDDERLDVEALIDETLPAFAREAFGARAWTAEDDERPAEPPATAPTVGAPRAPTLEVALEDLARAIEGAKSIDADVRHDLGLDVKILLLEARRRAPARERLEGKLGAFAAHGELAEPVDRVRRLLP